jgi:hypothetical protein
MATERELQSEIGKKWEPSKDGLVQLRRGCSVIISRREEYGMAHSSGRNRARTWTWAHHFPSPD